jgi:hypothetical protein
LETILTSSGCDTREAISIVTDSMIQSTPA